MTEERFETTMEHFGDAIERHAESAANVIDKSLNLAWKSRPVRVVGNTITFLTAAGLIVSAIPLNKRGYHRAARNCLIGGSIIIAARAMELVVFRRT